jgi:hypothetical protein
MPGIFDPLGLMSSQPRFEVKAGPPSTLSPNSPWISLGILTFISLFQIMQRDILQYCYGFVSKDPESRMVQEITASFP